MVYPIQNSTSWFISNFLTVNFLGPNDEYVTSGSDDGNFFLWNKSSGKIHGIYEGDSSVVNVIEGHPHLPIWACSGIDRTVKVSIPTLMNTPYAGLSPLSSFLRQLVAPANFLECLRRNQ